jgi:hypothetical protein
MSFLFTEIQGELTLFVSLSFAKEREKGRTVRKGLWTIGALGIIVVDERMGSMDVKKTGPL